MVGIKKAKPSDYPQFAFRVKETQKIELADLLDKVEKSITEIYGYRKVQDPASLMTDGETWFNNQSPETQRQQMGGAMYDAWKAGDVRIQDIPETFSDPVFGGMVKAASLKGLLGKDAAQYYQ